MIEKLQNALEAVRQEAYMDDLTGLYNRKALTRKLDQLLEKVKETSQPVSALMLDIDYFKRFNVAYGHLIGDEIIRRVVVTLKRHHDSDTIAARLGGEELTLVMPDTAIDEAVEVAKSINEAVAKLILMCRKTQERLPGITISVGAASSKPGDNGDDLLERVDQALYLAKCKGRNRVICARQLIPAAAVVV